MDHNLMTIWSFSLCKCAVCFCTEFYKTIRENRRNNREWTIQRHSQHWLPQAIWGKLIVMLVALTWFAVIVNNSTNINKRTISSHLNSLNSKRGRTPYDVGTLNILKCGRVHASFGGIVLFLSWMRYLTLN
jgi:hypothetical protein